MSRASRVAGFTLLEVLVALAVLATALTGAIALAGRSAADLAYLDAKTWSHWVALNQLAAVQLAGVAADERVADGVEELGGRRWHWTVRLERTPNAAVRRILVEVRGDDAGGEIVSGLAGYAALAQETAR